VKAYKQWFKTRALKNAHGHYYNTGAEVKSNSIIDDMFAKLDEDGGGTLDCDEIAALFKENGIHMSAEQVANMFGEA
jgi:Ca2+-binding EF-hand superfamily protein